MSIQMETQDYNCMFLGMTPTQIVCNETSERLCTSSDCIRAASYLLESMDFRIDPCEDFYEFTCGNWAKYHTRLDSVTRWSWYDIITKRVEHAIRAFLKSKPAAYESKVIGHCRTMYESCMKLNTSDDQMESGRRRAKELLKEYCFPYIHKEDRNCTFDWKATLEKVYTFLGQLTFRSVNIYSPGIQKKVQHYIDFLQPYETIAIDNPNGLQSFIWWMVIDNLIGSIRFNYNIYYRNISINQSNQCAQLVNDRMGMFLGEVIAMPIFLNETKPKLLNSFEEIRSAFNELVENSDWMDQPTKRAVIEKSQAMKVNIGFAEFLLNKTKVDEYLKDFNFTNSSFLVNEHMIAMGHLQFPFYGLGIEALNYGVAISTLGHEFVHGFGKVKDGWTNQTENEYRNRANCFLEQYKNFDISEIDQAINGTVNGTRTLDENIADTVGLLLAYKAYKIFIKKHGEEEILPAFQTFTPEQLFFIGYGNSYCASATPEELMRSNANDEHSLEKFRVNGVVSNLEEFRATFKCKANSKMVSKNPCRIW
ncbi:neprilysin-like [Sitodiplosis mosellana]|uniref:neprilysin-like n=1 Tax=Sitodiplosis mosellana TaxID=263140 RepID=UPI0024444193|nr:neprilysin-like [Sitodiplosis mosellana]